MKKFLLLMIILVLLLQACASPPELEPTTLPTANAPAPSLPLTEQGNYKVGKRTSQNFLDPNRGNRKVSITIWYPAQEDQANPEQSLVIDGNPDLNEAPYPMMLSSTKVADIFAPHLVSHGFTWVSVDGIDSSDEWGRWLIDQPRDLLFALEIVSEQPVEGLEGVIDTNKVGSMGYSFDAFNSLMLSGARVDPEEYKENCENARLTDNPPEDWWIAYCCDLLQDWDAFEKCASPAITSTEDGMWQPLTDDRIIAFMPMAPEGAWLFNERGLAAVERPIMIIGAEDDTINYYDIEAASIFEQLGSSEKYFITFMDKGHMMIYSTMDVNRMKHFATAFFGYYLQEIEEYKTYFSEEFVDQYQELEWGLIDHP